MLQDLLQLADTVATDDDDEGVWFSVVAVRNAEPDLELDIACRWQSDEAQEEQVWRVTCRPARQWAVRDGAAEDIALCREHPLLLDFSAPTRELYFSSRPDDIPGMLGDLYAQHRLTVRHWRELEQYLREDAAHLFEGGHGLLASGPEPVLQAYASALGRRGVRHSMTPARPPIWWDGEKWISMDPPPQVLLIGNSYAIAHSFDAVRVSAASTPRPE